MIGWPLLTLQSFFTNGTEPFGQTWLTGWAPLCVLAGMTAILINALFLMFGRAFSIKELEAFATSEVLQAIATILIAVFLVVIVDGAIHLSSDFMGGTIAGCGGKGLSTAYNENQPLNTMNDTFGAIRCRLADRALDVANAQQDISSGLGTAFQFNFLNLQISVFGVTVFRGDWVSSIYAAAETKRMENNFATVMLVGLDAQSSLLEYLRLNMLHVFLPVGILLRSIYPTRGVGALLMSIGIGMYFMFPVFYVLLDPTFIPAPPKLPAPPEQHTAQQVMSCFPTMKNIISAAAEFQNSGLGTGGGIITQQSSRDLTKSYILLIVHPLVALFITMTIIRYMMTILGADTYDIMRMMSKVI